MSPYCLVTEGAYLGEDRRNLSHHGGSGSQTMEVPRLVITSPKQPPTQPPKQPTSAVESFMNLVDGCTVVPSTAPCRHPRLAGPLTTNASFSAEGRNDADTDDGVSGSRDIGGSVGRAFDYVRKMASSCGCSLAMLMDEQPRDDDKDDDDDGTHHEGRIIDVPIKGEEEMTNTREILAYNTDISLLTDDTPIKFQRRYYDVSDGMRWFES